ncbi:MAG: hypothetical protein BMS9Abin09_0315 [Gammaproteobacteria bacterium]|nr:MAG: hypothetical protein BMS9Abin09_0315 [Gammaproteobacteria bacterium]
MMNVIHVLLITIAMFCTAEAFAASNNEMATKFSGPKNYYSADKLRGQVERYHIGPGIQKMEAGRYRYAKNDFDFILRHYPNHPRALSLVGELAIRTNNTDMAIPYFQRAISLYPDTATTYAAYAVFLHKIDRLDEAINNYKRSIELNPSFIETHYNLGLAYFQAGQYSEANREAQLVYRKNYPLPALRQKLIKVKAWNPDISMTAGDKAQ